MKSDGSCFRIFSGKITHLDQLRPLRGDGPLVRVFVVDLVDGATDLLGVLVESLGLLHAKADVIEPDVGLRPPVKAENVRFAAGFALRLVSIDAVGIGLRCRKVGQGSLLSGGLSHFVRSGHRVVV